MCQTDVLFTASGTYLNMEVQTYALVNPVCFPF